MKTTTGLALIILGSSLILSCGADISEKEIRSSDRLYKAGVISWFDERDNLAAIRHLTMSVEKNPLNDDAHYLLGTIRLGREEFDEAEKHLRIALKLRGKDRIMARVEALNSLGVLLIHKKELTEAVALLKEASGEVLNREPWLSFGNLGWAYIEMGEYPKAIETLRRALFDQHLFCVGHYRLGQAYYRNGNFEKALESLNNAASIEINGCNQMQEIFHFMGMAYLQLNRKDEARDAFARCIEISPVTEIGSGCAAALSDF